MDHKSNITTRIERTLGEIKVEYMYQGQCIGNIVGYPTIGLVSLEVDINHRRQGIGTALVQEYILQCKKFKCKRVVLTCSSDNIAAIRLYQNLGFDCFVEDENSDCLVGDMTCVLAI